MHRPLRSHAFTGALLVLSLGSAGLGGCQPSSAASESSSPPVIVAASPSPTAPVIDSGTITLTDKDCTWDANPGSMPEGRLTIAVRNETADHGLFIVHKLRPGRTFDEGRVAIAAIQEALKTGAEWPDEVSDAITEAGAEACLGGDVTVVATAGTFGVVCSANTSPTGDILTVFLVGPLEVTRP